MNYIKQISFYKWVNILLLLTTAFLVGICFWLLNIPCDNAAIGQDCLYDTKYAFYQPIYFGGFVLSLILGLMMFVPSNIFRKWLFFIAMPVIVGTFLLVIDISVYSSNVMQMTRASMAQFGMYVLAAVTAVFVLGHLLYDYKKRP